MPPRAAASPPPAKPKTQSPWNLFLITLLITVVSTGYQMYRAGTGLADVHSFFAPDGIVGLMFGNVTSTNVTLYGNRFSTCTQRVEMVLKEKSVPYELVELSFAKGEHKAPDYVAEMQPFGQVPVLKDGDFQLFESRAIGRYIASKYPFHGQHIIPLSNLTSIARFEQAASIEMADFDPYVSGLMYELVFKKGKGLGDPDPARVAQLKSDLANKLEGYERILSKQKYLAGNFISVVDMFHIPYGAMAIRKGVNWHEAQPNVARWWNDISSRPSWKEIESRYSESS